MARSRAARFFTNATTRARGSISESTKQQAYCPPPVRTLTLARLPLEPTPKGSLDECDMSVPSPLCESFSFPGPVDSRLEPLFHDVYIDSDQSIYNSPLSASSRRWSIDSQNLRPLSPMFSQEDNDTEAREQLHDNPTYQSSTQETRDTDLESDSDSDSVVEDYEDEDDIELHDFSDVQGVSYFSAGKPLLIDVVSLRSRRSRDSSYTTTSSSYTGTQYDDSDRQSSVATSNSSISEYAGVVPTGQKLYRQYSAETQIFAQKAAFPILSAFVDVPKETFFVDTTEDVLIASQTQMGLPGLAS